MMSSKIAKSLFPPIAYSLAKSLYYRYRFWRWPNKQLLEKNKELLSLKSQEAAFLIATGPSLNLENLQQLTGKDCYSVSNFFLHPDLLTVNPKIHFFAPYHPPLIFENYAEWLISADKKLPPETKICLSHETESIVQAYKIFQNRDIYYIYLSHEYPKKITLTKPILSPQSGPIMMLPILLAMQYKKIYLLGCDHTALRNFGGTISHFYTAEKDARKNASDTNAWAPLKHELMSNLKLLEQYNYYAQIAKIQGTEIINLSQDSWLDIFPKNRLNDV